MKNQTPSYISALLQPNGKKPQGRKVWSLDLEHVWLPFFVATNTVGDTRIPPEAIGCPIRLAYGIDGGVKFSKAGRPVTRVAKELSESIKMVRENFAITLQGYAKDVNKSNPEGYKATLALAQKTGEPITLADKSKLEIAIAQQVADTIAKAEAQPQETPREATNEEDKVLATA